MLQWAVASAVNADSRPQHELQDKCRRLTQLSLRGVWILGVQDRDQRGLRTPRWRGVTLMHELRSHQVPVAIASDNIRDQFYAYGDLDMIELFNQVCLLLPSTSSHTLWAVAAQDVFTHTLALCW